MELISSTPFSMMACSAKMILSLSKEVRRYQCASLKVYTYLYCIQVCVFLTGLPSASVSPVFPTELKQPSGHSAVSEGVSPTARIAGDTPQDKKLPKEGFLEESVDSSQRQERTHLKHKEQNFILRNIEVD